MNYPITLSERALNERGQLDLKSKSRAIECYHRFLQTPLSSRAILDFVEAGRESGNRVAVDALIHAAGVLSGLEEDSVLRCSEVCMTEGLTQEAFALLGRAFLHPASRDQALLRLATYLSNEGEIDAGLRLLELVSLPSTESSDFAVTATDILFLAERRDEALDWAHKAYRRSHDRTPTLLLARLLWECERPDEAVQLLEEWLAGHPDDADAYANLTSGLLRFGRFARCEAWSRQAISACPKAAALHFHFAWVLLAQGKWKLGWQEYEWRKWLKATIRSSDSRQPKEWRLEDGESGGSILVREEQGFGDSFMFAQYLPELRKHFDKVVFSTYPESQSLFHELGVADQVVASNQPPPKCDHYVSMCSLPLALGLNSTEKLRECRRIPRSLSSCPLPFPDRKRIGLVWATNTSRPSDDRSLSAEDLSQALGVADHCTLAILQQGIRHNEIPLDILFRKNVIDLSKLMPDWRETANVLLQLDGLVTIDTGIAHLAGLLDVPCAVVLSPRGEWRWLCPIAMPEFATKTIWYNSLRVFRPETVADYGNCFQRALKWIVE